MIDDATCDDLIAGFWRAATGETSWAPAMAAVRQAFGAQVAVLHTLDLVDQGRLLALEYGGAGPRLDDAVLNYIREWHLRDPRRGRFLQDVAGTMGRWLHCHEAFDDAYASRDPFFAHYLAGYGSRYQSNIVLPVTDRIATALVIELPPARGPLDESERHVARRLSNHLQEALHAFERVRRAVALAAQPVLDALPFPTWLIDADRFVSFANVPARRETDAETRVALAGQRLVLRSGSADRELGVSLTRLAAHAHGARVLFDIRARRGDQPAWLSLVRVDPPESYGAFGARPVMMATLFGAEWAAALDQHALAEVYTLTPAQARVAVQLAEGQPAAAIAQRLGIGLATVRTHVRAVLAQLGVARVDEAIRLLRDGELLWARAGEQR